MKENSLHMLNTNVFLEYVDVDMQGCPSSYTLPCSAQEARGLLSFSALLERKRFLKLSVKVTINTILITDTFQRLNVKAKGLLH